MRNIIRTRLDSPSRPARRGVRRSRWFGSAVLAAAAVVGLGTATPASAITNGTTIGETEQQDFGVVTLTVGDASCSGVLLAADWALTAGHCVDTTRTAPAALTVTMLEDAPAESSSPADAIYLFAGFADEVGPDLALVHLARPLTVTGNPGVFGDRFWPGTLAELGQGERTASIYGQGDTMAIQCTPTYDGTGAGTYRSGTVDIAGVGYEPTSRPNGAATSTRFTEREGGRYLRMTPTAAGQLQLPGDSGGPVFVFNPPDNRAYLAGIVSGGACSGARSHAVAIPAVRDWIHAALSSRWQPGSTGANVWVSPAEGEGVRWPVGDVNTAGWAQSARAAAAMCYARGYAGGHYDGHQGQLDGRTGSGILCAAGDQRWFDVDAAAIAATGWAFTDVNTVSWAQANRAAERLCAGLNDGGQYAGGHFTGHQRDGRYGVLCYRGGAQWFDATDAQIAATGWGFATPRLDEVPWSQAARAATGFCRGQGFAGGFMNGQHIPGRYGIVCQK